MKTSSTIALMMLIIVGTTVVPLAQAEVQPKQSILGEWWYDSWELDYSEQGILEIGVHAEHSTFEFTSNRYDGDPYEHETRITLEYSYCGTWYYETSWTYYDWDWWTEYTVQHTAYYRLVLSNEEPDTWEIGYDLRAELF